MTFIVPDNTTFENETLKTPASMVIGNHAVIGCNLCMDTLMAGEGVQISGQVDSESDIRADVWCKFDKDVNAGGDVYLGEFTTINGKIIVAGDLDIGKEVKLNGGFLSKGWVVVRNPLPIMIFIFIYIRELIGLGKTSEEIDKALTDLFEDDEEIDLEKLAEMDLSKVIGLDRLLIIPIGSKISSESINVPEDAVVGNDCFLSGKIICKNFEAGKNLTMTGDIRARGDIILSEGTKVTGNISANKLILDKNVTVSGNINAKSVLIHETSFVDGKISSGNVRFVLGDFDPKNPNAEGTNILSKSESVDWMKTNVREKPPESELDAEADVEIDVETETDAEVETDVEVETGTETEISVETEPLTTDQNTESETAAVPNVETEAAAADAKPSKRKTRNQNRRAAFEKKKKDDLVIVDVFSGEEMKNEITSEPASEIELVEIETETVVDETQPESENADPVVDDYLNAAGSDADEAAGSVQEEAPVEYNSKAEKSFFDAAAMDDGESEKEIEEAKKEAASISRAKKKKRK
ncbi:polymer-forming cytoskeletal protein [Methanolapillus africanus]